MTVLVRATYALALMVMATLSSAATQKNTNDESGKKLRRRLPAATATTHLSSSSSDSSSKSTHTSSKSSKSSTKSSKGGRRKKRVGRYDSDNRPEKKPTPVPRTDGNIDSTPSVDGDGNGDSKPGNVHVDSKPSVSVPHVKGCIDKARYYEIDADIQEIASQIDNDKDRSHFYGGLLRLPAHDFSK